MNVTRHDETAESGSIRVRGARVHNLQNIDVDIPRDRLVVVTGPSGSGKSSLAFDTIYAEGQRQYIESLSTYARQFLHQMERPDVDLLEGLEPTICIDQRRGNANPRSTVATVTEIHDYLRLLLARLGTPHCHQCGAPIRQQSVEQIQASLMALPEGTKVMLLAPLVRGRRGEHKDVLARVRKEFVRVRIDGQLHDVDQLPELEPRRAHRIDAVVDRVVIRSGSDSRISESLRTAVRQGAGLMIACHALPGTADGQARNGDAPWRDELFSTLHACPDCGVSYAEIEPRTFSFNSPHGACTECDGLGWRVEMDPDMILADARPSLAQGAILPWKGLATARLGKIREQLAGFLDSNRVGWDKPLADWPPELIDNLLRGDGGRPAGPAAAAGDAERGAARPFRGVLEMLEKEYATATNTDRRDELELFRSRVECSACQGSRLRPEANHVRVGDRTIREITRLSIHEASAFFESLAWSDEQRPIAQPILAEILHRLRFLSHVGVPYLTLDRAADTLSGGELQRVRLATSIGSGLVGVCYVLDEPSIGLHQRDNERLIESLRALQRQGNTVLVVEHDEATMRAADWVIDMGPGAGVGGGRIVAQGTPAELAEHPESLTGKFLSGRESIAIPLARRRTAKSRSLVLEGVSTNNLRDVTARFPLGALVCVTGVSGSGKSSLVNETLSRSLARRLGLSTQRPGPHKGLRGASQVDQMIEIDQSPIGRTPRSNPATYTGVFDEIRKVFAHTRDARQRGYTLSRFSFNGEAGRCPQCEGHGVRKIEMNFLPDLYVTCGECHGARFNRATLEVRFREKSIADVLAMSVDEALEFFGSFAQIQRTLRSLSDVGLGYLQLGQPSTTLSGGEAQRVKLATQLARTDSGQTLYLLDEPTTGLHFEDIRRLLAVLGQLVDRGNTVIVIEHNLDVIKCADWILDLGPEGGAGGGLILAEGTPEEIARLPDNQTARFLRPLLVTET